MKFPFFRKHEGIPQLRQDTPPLETAGTSGTPIYDGYIQVKEKNPDLVGDKRYETYADLFLNVSIVAAGVRYFLNLLSQPSWQVVPAPDSGAEGERIAGLVQEMMADMETPWRNCVRRAAMFPMYGFSLQEWTAKRRDDGAIGMQSLDARPQSTITRWDTDPTGTVLGAVQIDPYDSHEIYLPRNKLVYLVEDAFSDSPEGIGLFRHIAEHARVLKRYEQLEGVGFETDLRGIPFGRAPLAALDDAVKNNTLDPEERDAILRPLRDFVTNHIKNPKLGILLDSMTYQTEDDAQRPSNIPKWSIDLMKAGATSQPDILRSIERKLREIALILGVENLLLGSNGVGSFAQAKDKSTNFYLVVDSTLQALLPAFQRDWIRPIVRLNGWDPKLTPTLKSDKIQYRSLEEVTGALRDMAQAGALLDPADPAIKEVRALAGLSDPIVVRAETLLPKKKPQ